MSTTTRIRSQGRNVEYTDSSQADSSSVKYGKDDVLASDVENNSTSYGETVKDTLDSAASAIDLDRVKGQFGDALCWMQEAMQRVTERVVDKAATTVVTVAVTGDEIQDAIDAAADGDIIEVANNGPYNPITIPGGIQLTIRRQAPFLPVLTGTNCLVVQNGANDVIVSGLTFDTYTTARKNAWGAGISMEHYAIIEQVIFHNLTFHTPTLGSAVLMGYHVSIGGDLYYAPQLRSENSHHVAFLGCMFEGACVDGNEGANLSLRGMEDSVCAFNIIDCQELSSRGIQLQNSIGVLIYSNDIRNCSTAPNGEGVKIDRLGDTTWFNTARIDSNYIDTCKQGMEIDDFGHGLLLNNRVTNCVADGVAFDTATNASLVENEIGSCAVGVRLSDEASGMSLISNRVYDCTVPFVFEDGGYRGVIVWLDGVTGCEDIVIR